MKDSYALGLVYIVSVSIIWSAASLLVQYLYQGLDFDSPFILTYIGTSLLMILIPIFILNGRKKMIWNCLCDFITCKEGICKNRESSSFELSSSSLAVRQVDDNGNSSMFSIKAQFSSEGTPLSLNSDYDDESQHANDETILSSTSSQKLQLQPLHKQQQQQQQRHDDDDDEFDHDCSNLLSHRDHIGLAMQIAPFWFISNYFYNLSLKYTTIT